MRFDSTEWDSRGFGRFRELGMNCRRSISV
jgi:hypothetical protein